MVIQGPPGTGKSQTIANLIAAAIHDGKSVLFVAEKAAALEVVYERLRSSRLSHLCLELHSRRSSKQQVLGQLREALNSGAPSAVANSLYEQLDEAIASLWSHSDRLHRRQQPNGSTPFEIIGRICRLRDRGVAVPDFKVNGAETWSRSQIDKFATDVGEGARRLEICGVPARHPWRECERAALNPLDVQRLTDHCSKLNTSLDALTIILRSLWPLIRASDTSDVLNIGFREIRDIAKGLELAAAKPEENIELLCHARWATEVEQLEQLADVARQLAQIEEGIQPVLIDAAWTMDWTTVRAEIASNGESLLRFLRGPYRRAIRTYRGACRERLPAAHSARLAVLDRLTTGQRLRAKLEELRRFLGADLVAIWPSLPTAWPRVAKLAAWLRDAESLRPHLLVRNPKLLTWSEAPIKWAERLTAVASTVVAHLNDVAAFVQLRESGLHGNPESITSSIGEILERARAWKLSAERFNEWPPARAHLAALLETTGPSFHQKVYAGQIQPMELVDRVRLAICEQIWNQMCKEDVRLADVDGRMLDRLVSDFRQLDQLRVAAAASQVGHRHFERKPTGSVGEMAIVRQEINKVRKLLPVRKLLDVAGNAIQLLKPVFLMSPLSVAQYIAPGRLKFDLLLIDEASQVRPEDALGAVARADQIVVVGDPKQLPPTNFFNRLVADGDGDADDGADYASFPTPAIEAMESILTLCDATLSSRTVLRWHYRSHHPALIAVSNDSFYENKLLLPPAVVIGQAADGLGVHFNKTPVGAYDRGRSATNVVEAELVAEAVCRFARVTPEKTLGVGTFSVAQRDVIRDRIDSLRREQPELEAFFSPSRENPFFVKNLESIQGDERDVVFISVGYGRDREGRLSQSFGPINNDGGERRLNVLISRARERCEVFSSLTGDDIDISSGKAGVVALKRFLQFAEKGYMDVPQLKGKSFDSDFEESVADFLKRRDYAVHAQVGMAGFFIDLGVLDPNDSQRYLLGIECDGATYHASRSARDRDRIRQQILESRGWHIHRIWSTDWFNRRSTEERRLLDALERAQRTPRREQREHRHDEALVRSQLQVITGNGNGSPEQQRSGVLYTEASFTVNCREAPHEASSEKVQDAVRRIVDIEGPVHQEEVARRLATVWGLERAGARIQETARNALRALQRAGMTRSEGEFWTKADDTSVRVRDRSKTESITLRRAEYLPPAEVSIAALEVVKESVRVPMDQLITETARKLGFQRTGPDLQQVILKVVEDQVGKTLNRHDDGSVMLAAQLN